MFLRTNVEIVDVIIEFCQQQGQLDIAEDFECELKNRGNLHFSFFRTFFHSPPFFLVFFFFRTPRTEKHHQKVPTVDMTIFLVTIRFWGLRGQGFKNPPLSRFSFFLFFSSFQSFFLSFSFSNKNISLLASVSDFNCRSFLCSRCSMEMWCPDDIRRDSWD